MTEQAKTVHIIYRDYVDKFVWDDEVSCKKAITALIDAEFAGVVKERDELKKALGKLVEAAQELKDLQNGPPLIREAAQWENAMRVVREGIAAAEKLLEGVDNATDEPEADAGRST